MITVPHGSWHQVVCEPRHVGDPRGEELHAACLELRSGARRCRRTRMPTWVMPTLVTEGRPGSGGSDVGRRILDQLNDAVVLPEAHDGGA